MEIEIGSRSFSEGEMIPSKFTCDGANISPQLNWNCSVEGVKTFTIIVEDPDASSGNFIHWIVYNIPSRVNSLMENSTPSKNIPDEVLMGTNDFGRIGYGGPCPPSGTHRYYFRIYGLNTAVHLDSGATRKEVLKKMEGHIIARGELMGKYGRGGFSELRD
ncbi:MAG TPA: YbhB/YbcL family Raf kinase inhibitor-like protein [Ignavibacteriaceae bacterium]|nr:YbhB/YbcL family Raf kinase inhibitor-like protein [Ignavibacteriaceae bacterium]